MSYLTTVITAYNRSDIIQNAINSSLREFPDQKIIVVDDASSDDLQKSLINQFFDEINSGIIKVYYLKENVGVTGAKNYGFHKSKTDWVIFLDSDDEYSLNCGNDVLFNITKFSNHPVVFFRCVDLDNKIIGKRFKNPIELNLKTYISKTSYGEALTAINKKIINNQAPYLDFLRGYEGIGCALIIRDYGNAILSNCTARIYNTHNTDRLSSFNHFIKRIGLLSKGHFLMVKFFKNQMSIMQIFIFYLKGSLYYLINKIFNE